MAKKWYGNVINRIEEGRTVPEIKEDTDITMYMWSDRYCYYVTKVVNQKNIFVKEYHVCADQDAPCMSNTWKYFKTDKEEDDYLKKYFPDTERNLYEPEPSEWVYRYNKWQSVTRWNEATMKKFRAEYPNMKYPINFTAKDIYKFESGKEVCKYYDLRGKVSFGRRDYYCDYSF